MATSSAVSQGDLAAASQYNNLRTDVLSTHIHDGTDGNAALGGGVGAGLSQVRVQDNGLLVDNPAGTFAYTIVGGALAASYNLNLPVLTVNDTFGVLGLSQTFTQTQSFSGTLRVTGTLDGNGSAVSFGDGITFDAAATIMATGNLSLDTTSTVPAVLDTTSHFRPGSANGLDLGDTTNTWSHLYVGTNAGAITIGGDVELQRGAANQLDLGSNDGLQLSGTGDIKLATDGQRYAGSGGDNDSLTWSAGVLDINSRAQFRVNLDTDNNSTADHLAIFHNAADGGGTELMRFTDEGSIQIGGTAVHATIAGTNHISMFNGTAPTGALTNGASFYVSSGEMNVIDSAGNVTLLSPHDRETEEWIFYSRHTPTGRVLRVRMEELVKRLNRTFNWDLVEEYVEAT